MSEPAGKNGDFMGLPSGWPRLVASLGAVGVVVALLAFLVVGLARNFDQMTHQRAEFLEEMGGFKARQEHVERMIEKIMDRLPRAKDEK